MRQFNIVARYQHAVVMSGFVLPVCASVCQLSVVVKPSAARQQPTAIFHKSFQFFKYEGKYLIFENEAYRYFQQTVGIERYKDIVFEATLYIIRDLLLIGFSIGTSAIWVISVKFGILSTVSLGCRYISKVECE